MNCLCNTHYSSFRVVVAHTEPFSSTNLSGVWLIENYYPQQQNNNNNNNKFLVLKKPFLNYSMYNIQCVYFLI